MAKNNIPTILIIFGATGDLIAKKIVPALYHLFQKEKLPKLFHVIGVSRRKMTTDHFRKNIVDMLKKHHNLELHKSTIDKFTLHFSYHEGNFEHRDSYKKLATTLGNIDGQWKVCANKLFYLAVPPGYYKTIFNHLADSGLTIPCGPDGGWTRVLVEKPFGNDAETAESLDMLLGKLFKEEQIYRIDHYLAKEMLQSILTFRFSNNILESSWNNKYIESIIIRQYENFGVDRRGAFYDGVGALRDVGQNHLLQMLALVTMDHPGSLNAEYVRPKRAAILNTLNLPTHNQLKIHSFRAQFKGYRKVEGVKKDSTTETYFQVQAHLQTPRWQGVPILLEHGKNMKQQKKEVIVTFRHNIPCLCPDKKKHYKNKVIFSLEPHEQIKIFFLSKALGLETNLEEHALDFTLRRRSARNQYVEEYEKLLLDCIEGNQLLFVSTDEVKAMWRYTDPIVAAWKKDVVPLAVYKPRTNDAIKLAETTPRPTEQTVSNHSTVGIVGLGKMGQGIARQLIEKGWNVVGYNRSADVTKDFEKYGMTAAFSVEDFVKKLPKPRVVWMMVPSGKPVDEMLFAPKGLLQYLEKGDIVVDAGNSFYKDAKERAKKLNKKGIHFIDIGTSGGPSGARNGACLMVGGDRKTYEYLLPLLINLAIPNGVQFFSGTGAGHFVKMIHNGIEYGMMQAIAEGFTILKESSYKLDLTRVTEIYNNGSVIESRLVKWLESAFYAYGEKLDKISGSVGMLGEGEWTVRTAKEMDLKAKIIEESLKFRYDSEKNPSYTGKILSALRNQFGGHSIEKLDRLKE